MCSAEHDTDVGSGMGDELGMCIAALLSCVLAQQGASISTLMCGASCVVVSFIDVARVGMECRVLGTRLMLKASWQKVAGSACVMLAAEHESMQDVGVVIPKQAGCTWLGVR